MNNNVTKRSSQNEFGYNYLIQQSEEMKKLNEEINKRQLQFNNDIENKLLFNEEACCTPEVFRERIKEIEKAYIDLKCKFLTFQSTIR